MGGSACIWIFLGEIDQCFCIPGRLKTYFDLAANKLSGIIEPKRSLLVSPNTSYNLLHAVPPRSAFYSHTLLHPQPPCIFLCLLFSPSRPRIHNFLDSDRSQAPRLSRPHIRLIPGLVHVAYFLPLPFAGGGGGGASALAPFAAAAAISCFSSFFDLEPLIRSRRWSAGWLDS